MLYGAGEANLSLSLDTRDFMRVMRTPHIAFEIEVDGRIVPVALREMQFDRLGDLLQHVDFQRDPKGEVGRRLIETAHTAEAKRKKMVEAAIEHHAFEEAQRKAAEAAAAAVAAAASPGSAAAGPGAAAAPAAGAAGAAAPAAAPAKEGGKEKPGK
jgi:ribosomal protein L25 (general stress protein Ctc)